VSRRQLARVARHGQALGAQLFVQGLDAPLGGRPAIRDLQEFSRRWSIAVFMNIARMIGAGPLIVIDTEVVDRHRSKPE